MARSTTTPFSRNSSEIKHLRLQMSSLYCSGIVIISVEDLQSWPDLLNSKVGPKGLQEEDTHMTRDIKVFEINDLTTIDSTESDGGTIEITDLKEGDRVTIDVDDQNVIHRIEIEPSDEKV